MERIPAETFLFNQKQPLYRTRQSHQTPLRETVILALLNTSFRHVCCSNNRHQHWLGRNKLLIHPFNLTIWFHIQIESIRWQPYFPLMVPFVFCHFNDTWNWRLTQSRVQMFVRSWISSHRPKTSALFRKTIYSEATDVNFQFLFKYINIYSNLYICEEMCELFVLKVAFKAFQLSWVAPVAFWFYVINDLQYCECIGCWAMLHWNASCQ